MQETRLHHRQLEAGYFISWTQLQSYYVACTADSRYIEDFLHFAALLDSGSGMLVV